MCIFCIKKKKHLKRVIRLKEGESCQDEWIYQIPERELYFRTDDVRRQWEENYF